jgi:hypothetical protein
MTATTPIMTEADTCRELVRPKLYERGMGGASGKTWLKNVQSQDLNASFKDPPGLPREATQRSAPARAERSQAFDC